MKSIFKYKLEVKDTQSVVLPANYRILSVANQNGDIVIYALIDPDEAKSEAVTILMRGTGHNADNCEAENFRNCTIIKWQTCVPCI
jgi:hypothetical protein